MGGGGKGHYHQRLLEHPRQAARRARSALHSLTYSGTQCIIRAFIQLLSYSSLHSLIHSCSLLAYILKLQSLGLGLGHTQGGAVNVATKKEN